MILEAKKIIALPVASMDEGERIGEVRKIIVDKNKGAIAALMVKISPLGKDKVLSFIDISEWDPNGIVTQSIDNLVAPEEIIRVNEIIKEKFDLLGLKAKTASGKSLGAVENFLLDTETGSIVKYYLKDLLGHERILSSDKVTKIDKQIIFSDGVEQIPPGAAGAIA